MFNHLQKRILIFCGRYGMLSLSNAGTLLENFNQYEQVQAGIAVPDSLVISRKILTPAWLFCSGHRVFHWSRRNQP